jgi:hypothetical protein
MTGFAVVLNVDNRHVRSASFRAQLVDVLQDLASTVSVEAFDDPDLNVDD